MFFLLKTVQAFLIHLFGGLTVEESNMSDYNSFSIGAYRALITLKDYADSMYGKEPKEWCESMYKKITHLMEDYESDKSV